MNTTQLKIIIEEQKRLFEKEHESTERFLLPKVEEYLPLPHCLVISGMRRSGKSTLLRQISDKFYKDKQQIYYFNFEDKQLLNFTVADFNQLYEAFIELYPNGKTFFFDEIQSIPQWELFVRSMYDRGFKFILTGSNSSMLSRELGTRLTGRYLPLELYPFSFKEFLLHKKITVDKTRLITEEKALIKKAFYEYVEKGGIPEYLKYENKELLNTLCDNILYKDILVRYGLQDEKSLKELVSYVFTNVSKEISYNKLRAILSVGSITTIKNYLHYLENSYLVFTLPQYHYSLNKQIYSPKKVYAIDTAFIKLLSLSFSHDFGRVLENIVFLELKRRTKQLYYHKEKYECDFLVREGVAIREAIQVTRELKENKQREYAGLLEAMKKYKLDYGLILTEDEEHEETIAGKKIVVMPVWKWLIS